MLCVLVCCALLCVVCCVLCSFVLCVVCCVRCCVLCFVVVALLMLLRLCRHPVALFMFVSLAIVVFKIPHPAVAGAPTYARLVLCTVLAQALMSP